MRDLTRQRFGRLVVISQAEDTFCRGQRKRNWVTLCDCGATHTVSATALLSGSSKSCGCLLRETNKRLKTVDRPRYHTFHGRMLRHRGPARHHACVDCEGSAEEWSYDHKDAAELMDGGKRYSLKYEHYEPRCVSCHRKLDKRTEVV